MINITTIKSRGQKLLDLMNSLVEAADYDPRVDMYARIRVLEKELAALKTKRCE